MKKIYVMGDIHGAHKAFKQCLERSGFNKKEDTLIQLGDVCDGWSEVYECVEELLTIPNLIAIKGNHDDWFNEYLQTGQHGSQWTQGAHTTRNSYGERSFMIPESHEKFFRTQLPYYIDDQNRCFVHGGFNRHFTMKENQASCEYMFWWDRDLWASALSYKAMDKGLVYLSEPKELKFKIKDDFKEIFIGHTTTINWKTDKPMQAANIWNLDTGGGFKGKLTIMNVDTKEYFQSDLLTELYPNEKGRN